MFPKQTWAVTLARKSGKQPWRESAQWLTTMSDPTLALLFSFGKVLGKKLSTLNYYDPVHVGLGKFQICIPLTKMLWSIDSLWIHCALVNCPLTLVWCIYIYKCTYSVPKSIWTLCTPENVQCEFSCINNKFLSSICHVSWNVVIFSRKFTHFPSSSVVYFTIILHKDNQKVPKCTLS